MDFTKLAHRLFIASILSIVALAGRGTGSQKTTNVLSVSSASSGFDLSDNYILITDMGTSRLVRVKDSTASGWEEGPTMSGSSLNWPWHFSLDSIGRVYIADRDNGRLVRMDDLAGNGWKTFSGAGANVLVPPPIVFQNNGNGNNLSSTAVDSAGRIYITTSAPRPGGGSDLVRIDDMDGNGWTTVRVLAGMKSVMLDGQNRIYISDNAGHQIIRFNDLSGAGMVTFGSYGNGVGLFNEPEGLTMDSQGRIYMADESNHRIIRIDDMTGAGWTTFGTYGHGNGQLSLPHDVQIDNQGRIYIADTANQRIVRINSMAGGGWVELARRGCSSNCGEGVTLLGAFMLTAPKGIRVIGSGPALTYSAVFPQVAVGGGYRTSIIGVNTGSVNVSAEVSFTKAAGQPCSGSTLQGCGAPFTVTIDSVPASTFNKNVAPMGMIRLDATSDGIIASGYGSFKSNEELSGVALFQTVSGNTITSEAGVGPSLPTDHFTVYIDNSNNAQTGYAIANPIRVWDTSQAVVTEFTGAQLSATLRDKAGVTLETQSFNVRGGSHLAEFASQRFPASVGPGFEGSIEFSTGFGQSNARAVALRYDNASQDVFTTVPVILNVPDQNEVTLASPQHKTIPRFEATTLFYPQVADGGTYRTNFILVNPADAATSATLEFFADNGTALSLPIDGVARTAVTVSLNAKGVARILTDGTSSEIHKGWARVTQPPVVPWAAIGGSAIFQTVVEGRITSEAGVSSSPIASHFTTVVNSLDSTQSGIAICNPNNSNVNVTLNLRDTSGQIVASVVKTLAPLAHVAQYFTEMFPTGFDEFEGTLEIVSASGPVSGVALRYDNPGGTVFATAPVIVIP